MFGTRRLFHKANEISTVSSQYGEFLQRLYQQAKQVSQIIAYIWRWADENDEDYAYQKHIANELMEYFNKPTIETEEKIEVGGNLKKLFRADPRDIEKDQSPEAKLLRAVFYVEGICNEDYIFPIFDKFELGEDNPKLGYLFQINSESFHGTLEDVERNLPEIFKFIIPYPPRPIFGNATLDKRTLSEWIENRTKDQYFAENPYIPTTCS